MVSPFQSSRTKLNPFAAALYPSGVASKQHNTLLNPNAVPFVPNREWEVRNEAQDQTKITCKVIDVAVVEIGATWNAEGRNVVKNQMMDLRGERSHMKERVVSLEQENVKLRAQAGGLVEGILQLETEIAQQAKTWRHEYEGPNACLMFDAYSRHRAKNVWLDSNSI